jgi:hypothetical protein
MRHSPRSYESSDGMYRYSKSVRKSSRRVVRPRSIVKVLPDKSTIEDFRTSLLSLVCDLLEKPSYQNL